MPSAMPDTTTSPACARLPAKAWALAQPWGVGLRLPTMANAGALSVPSARPLPTAYSSSGGSSVRSSAAG